MTKLLELEATMIKGLLLLLVVHFASPTGTMREKGEYLLCAENSV